MKGPNLGKNCLKDYIIVELSSLISSGEKGKSQIEALGLNFPYCHSIGLYEDLVWSVTSEGKGITLDFFAGSGTTGHAVLNLWSWTCAPRFLIVSLTVKTAQKAL